MKESPYQILSEALSTPPKQIAASSEAAEAIYLSEQVAKMKLELNLIHGSLVASRTLDRLNHWNGIAADNDVRRLFDAYVEVKQMFTDPNLAAANKKLTRGAATQFTYEFSAKKPSDQARFHARFANQACEDMAERLNGTGWQGSSDSFLLTNKIVTIADISEQLGIFCNGVYQIAFHNDGTVADTAVMPPYAWQMRNNHQLRFRSPEQEDAYVYYDPATWQEDSRLKPINAVWYSANHAPDQRYGFPLAYNLHPQVAGLKRLFAGLPDARDNSFPEIVYLRDDKPASFEQLLKLWESLPEQRLKRGEQLSPEQFRRILTGIRDAKVLNSGTGYFNEFGDAELYQQMIALTFDLQLAVLMGAEKVNRATLEFLMRLLAMAQRLWAAHLTRTLIFPVFWRVLKKAKVDADLVRCEVKWREDETPEEMAAKATFATELQADGRIADETAHIIQCNYLGVEPKTDNERKERERKARESNPETNTVVNSKPAEQRTNLRISGLNPLRMPGQDIETQVANALASNALNFNK